MEAANETGANIKTKHGHRLNLLMVLNLPESSSLNAGRLPDQPSTSATGAIDMFGVMEVHDRDVNGVKRETRTLCRRY
jgi:hypothetical protein